MTERQYQQVLENGGRALRCGQRLAAPAGAILRAAAKGLRWREDARRAWERTARPEWLDVTAVEGVEEGLVVVAVWNAACLETLRPQAPHLSRDVRMLLPRVRGLRFVRCAGPPDN
ncbi:MAG: hypothetical protein KKB50_19790 [Planctomycetes bacterium]|nr:hypothetical protein [Planctomycetota bacterium]